VAGVLLVAVPGGNAAQRCRVRSDVGLHPVAQSTGPTTTLPPSHDNDTGLGRIPDHTPDNDIDANQRPMRCHS